MICPFCANDKTRVVATIKGLENRRFRYCFKCKKTFETNETVLIKERDWQELKEYKEEIKDV
ncbi:TPA: hypothetical protein RPW15_001915 [Campylobacter fetus subsp. venerealis]|uniref:Transcriptional repressor NrdR-like N-terminal domain-containing protein n=3 Tax=Campylobacter fetus TaxID=196 RepID=A0A5L4IES0_CAMFE|nr:MULTISPECIES: hypothetical protein [Campylobacter]OCS19999.1 transcriptional regulator [Campylobacter fetus subsp. venerealis cfvi97/532]OCS24652.1 transcriptional regulator [Campylobacter fetus subsp. venerealis cfvB10]OCS29988.1 transcriptional regulator [Campylobacter fetus subsp. venerealis LMG 6570 = CCUG 33900]OCS39200.1 hypothetical protein CFVI02298_09595 [Campylobacter fetus subsp. venerealis cfvi02/298]AIR80386.1 hypothetical protein CFV97608_0755 [Campylobacter fetus subsp. vener